MKKETFIKAFAMNPTRNYRIITNIAEGKGINGTDYQSYIGAWEEDGKGEYGGQFHHYVHNLVNGVCGDCVVLLHEEEQSEHWKSGKKTIFLPFENIVAVEFFVDGCKPYRGTTPLQVSEAVLDEI